MGEMTATAPTALATTAPQSPSDPLVTAFLRQVAARAKEPALYFRTGDRYAPIDWATFGRAARRFAAYLLSEGLGEHEHVAIWANNRPEWHIADAGILTIRCRPVPVYLTLSAEQGGYVLGHSESRVIVVEDEKLLDRVMEQRANLPSLVRIVVMSGQPADSHDGLVLGWLDALNLGADVEFENRTLRIESFTQ